VDDFYAARTANTTALPWSNFAPPFSSFLTDCGFTKISFPVIEGDTVRLPLDT